MHPRWCSADLWIRTRVTPPVSPSSEAEHVCHTNKKIDKAVATAVVVIPIAKSRRLLFISPFDLREDPLLLSRLRRDPAPAPPGISRTGGTRNRHHVGSAGWSNNFRDSGREDGGTAHGRGQPGHCCQTEGSLRFLGA
ncbi:MAG: hypothetical protein QOJ52_760 [Acidimicrobiaceae bacterium]|nr:hypothetical protein [Acidimicrobiaceae bacterium]